MTRAVLCAYLTKYECVVASLLEASQATKLKSQLYTKDLPAAPKKEPIERLPPVVQKYLTAYSCPLDDYNPMSSARALISSRSNLHTPDRGRSPLISGESSVDPTPRARTPLHNQSARSERSAGLDTGRSHQRLVIGLESHQKMAKKI